MALTPDVIAEAISRAAASDAARVENYSARTDVDIAYGSKQTVELSFKPRWIAVYNPGSFFIHFPQNKVLGEWVPPTTVQPAIIPFPRDASSLIVATQDLPAGYALDSSNLTAVASITLLRDFPQYSAGVQQVLSTKSGVSGITAANVQAFGAVGNGQNDDTAAIINADASLPAGGGIVWFPPGSYKTSSTIKPAADRTTWLGAGPSSQIVPTAAVAVGIDLTGRQLCKLQDLYVSQSNATSPFQAVVLGPGTFRCRLDRVFAFFAAPVAGQSAFAFTSSGASGAYWNVLTECFANGAGIGYDLGNTGAGGQNDNDFIACRAQACNTGWVLGGAAGLCIGNKIIGGTCDGQNTWGLDFGAVAGGNIVSGLYLENSGATGGPVRFQAGSQNNDVVVIMNAALGHNAITDNGSGNAFRSIISRPTAIENVLPTITELPGHLGSTGAVNPALGALQAGVAAQTLLAGSTDAAGIVQITTAGAGAPAAGAAIFALNFARAYGVKPVVIVSSANAALQVESAQTTQPTVNGFTVATNNALAINTVYEFHYFVIGRPN